MGSWTHSSKIDGFPGTWIHTNGATAGEEYGFCYVNVPTSCPDRIESESFRNEFDPEYSMYVSFEACRLRADLFYQGFQKRIPDPVFQINEAFSTRDTLSE